MSDSALLEKVQAENAEIKDDQKLAPGQPIEFTPFAYTDRGFAD